MVDYILITEFDRIFRNYFTKRQNKYGSPEIATRLALLATSYIIKKISTPMHYKDKILDLYYSRNYYTAVITNTNVVSSIYHVIHIGAEPVILLNSPFKETLSDIYKFQNNKNIQAVNRFTTYDLGAKILLYQEIPYGKRNAVYEFEKIPIYIYTYISDHSYGVVDVLNRKGEVKLMIEKKYLEKFKYIDYHLFIERFINHCNNIYSGRNNTTNNLISIYSIQNQKWTELTKVKQRTFESIYGEFAINIKKTVNTFIDEKEFRELHNVPNKLVILFHGPPGTGKTTLSHAIMHEFKRPGYKITFQENNVILEDYIKLIKDIPAGSVILFDDIDPKILSDEKYAFLDPDGKTKITHDTLLSWLDSSGGLPDDTILIISTNHVSTLSPALKRAGRVDLEYLIPPAASQDISKFFHNFYTAHRKTAVEGYTPEMAKRFAEKFHQKYKNPTIADTQAYLLNHIHNPVAAITEL